MVTKRSTQINITNATDYHVIIELTHQHAHHDPEFGTWKAAPRETVGSLTVNYETGPFTGLDYWWVKLTVKDGPKKGLYRSEGSHIHKEWKECMLESKDANSVLTFTVDTEMLYLNMNSDSCQTEMKRTGPYTPISNVFVLMLENHSFDHLLGFSAITGKDSVSLKPTTINGLSGYESNSYEKNTYKVQKPSVDPMPTDPGHEFLDTLEQLCGKGTANPFPKGPYPPINNSGFVANYATTTTEGPKPPPLDKIKDIMQCCDSESEVPFLTTLAKEFVVCDNWFSSIPGPTWPNRFFAMAASASGLDASPSTKDILKWEAVDGVSFSQGSLFQRIKDKGLKYRIYNDRTDEFGDHSKGLLGGEIAIVSALKGISVFDVHSLTKLSDDLKGNYPYQFTFIEPNYGDVINNTYSGGSSQHPMDSLEAGDKLIQDVFNTLRQSPQWESSLLIITYDEHGGFYDHVAPGPAVPPGDTPTPGLNANGFDFSNYGIRVPAVLVSPLIKKNLIDKTLYDHASIVETVAQLYDLGKFTDRSSSANTFFHLFEPTARQDCLKASDIPISKKQQKRPDKDFDPNQLLPERGNIHGFLFAALKAEIEMSDGSDVKRKAIIEEFEKIKTNGHAQSYFERIIPKIHKEKKQRQ